MRPEEWLLIEWPESEKLLASHPDEAEPTKHFLATAPSYATLEQMVFVTKVRWRIWRDYQDLKLDFGLGRSMKLLAVHPHEGRNWRGFPCIAFHPGLLWWGAME